MVIKGQMDLVLGWVGVREDGEGNHGKQRQR